MSDHNPSTQWARRWPVGTHRVEMLDRVLAFGWRPSDAPWEPDDVAAARRAYPGQLVTLSEDGRVLRVPPLTGQTDTVPNADATPASATGPSRLPAPPRRTLRVTADQVESARALIALRRGEENVDPVIRKLAAVELPSDRRRPQRR